MRRWNRSSGSEACGFQRKRVPKLITFRKEGIWKLRMFKWIPLNKTPLEMSLGNPVVQLFGYDGQCQLNLVKRGC